MVADKYSINENFLCVELLLEGENNPSFFCVGHPYEKLFLVPLLREKPGGWACPKQVGVPSGGSSSCLEF